MNVLNNFSFSCRLFLLGVERLICCDLRPFPSISLCWHQYSGSVYGQCGPNENAEQAGKMGTQLNSLGLQTLCDLPDDVKQ